MSTAKAERKEALMLQSKYQIRIKIWISTLMRVRTNAHRRNFCMTWYIQGFLETKLESNYNALMGQSSSDWGKHIQDVKKLPSIKLDGLCGFLCSLKSTCDRFVVDGPNCQMGQNTTTDGSVTSTFDKVWTTWVKAGWTKKNKYQHIWIMWKVFFAILPGQREYRELMWNDLNKWPSFCALTRNKALLKNHHVQFWQHK